MKPAVPDFPESLPAAALTVGQFRRLMREELKALREAEREAENADAERLSLARAAKLAHTRPASVATALRTGALPGTRIGRRWSTTVGSVRAWIDAGRPTAGGRHEQP